ncbi:hypothetical protein OG769_14785 [Streptomyces sp. NBC_01435]|nr:hypothetical protein [Streptomyces sp. NBC_01435]
MSPGRLRLRLGEFYPVPDVGLPDTEIQAWLLMLADRLKESIETGQAPPPAPPQTRAPGETAMGLRGLPPPRLLLSSFRKSS